ncbi:MAG: hypothetical protein ACSHXM_09370, partial [Paraglaciecola sp.]
MSGTQFSLLRRLPITYKFLLMLAPPVLLLIILSITNLTSNKSVMNESLHIEKLAELTVSGSALV